MFSLKQVVREPDITWEPPKTHRDVLDSRYYNIYQKLLHLASSGMKPFKRPKLEGPKKLHIPFKYKEERFQEIVSSSVRGGCMDMIKP